MKDLDWIRSRCGRGVEKKASIIAKGKNKLRRCGRFFLLFFPDGYVTIVLDVLCCGDKGGVEMFVPSTRATVWAALSRYCAIKLKWTDQNRRVP